MSWLDSGGPPLDEDSDDSGESEGEGPEVASARSPLALTDGHRESHLRVLAFDGSGRPTVLEHRFVVENECDRVRLDRFLMKRMPRLSRARIQRVIRGDLDVDGHRVSKPGALVLAGQRVSFRRPAPPEPEVPRAVGVITADPTFYVLDKPAGLPIHPTARYHYGTLTAVLRELFPDETVYVCHRLDRETSGLLLAARSRASAAALKLAFARRRVAKSYAAIVHGAVEAEFAVDAPLALDGGRVRVRMAVRAESEGGLPSRTVVRPLSRHGAYTLVEAIPETGRQHQIRVHLAHAGHPIVGDKLYPDEGAFIEWADRGLSAGLLARLELPRHALHAHRLSFPHPESGGEISAVSPLPSDLTRFLSDHR